MSRKIIVQFEKAAGKTTNDLSSIPELFQNQLYKRSEQKQNNTYHQLSSINGFSCDRWTVSALEHPVSSPPTLRVHPPVSLPGGPAAVSSFPREVIMGCGSPGLTQGGARRLSFHAGRTHLYKSGLTPVRAPTIWTIFQTKSPPSHVTQPNDFLWLFLFFVFSARLFLLSAYFFFFFFLLSHDCDCC